MYYNYFECACKRTVNIAKLRIFNKDYAIEEYAFNIDSLTIRIYSSELENGQEGKRKSQTLLNYILESFRN